MGVTVIVSSGDDGAAGYKARETSQNCQYDASFPASLMGVTVIVSSGDDGAAGYKARGTSQNCRYDASFPASSPYVTAVGATQGVECGLTEIACSFDTGGIITSGGGFSNASNALPFQSRAINGYLSTISPAPYRGYNPADRGFPDVSLAGAAYEVVVGGKLTRQYGTSASAHVFAGMVSLVNAARKSAGMSSVGFLNPALYASNGSFANDITSGDKLCTASYICCPQLLCSARVGPCDRIWISQLSEFL